MFCMFITLVSYFISVRQIYDTFIVHTLTEDVKVKRSSQVDIRIGNFFQHTFCYIRWYLTGFCQEPKFFFMNISFFPLIVSASCSLSSGMIIFTGNISYAFDNGYFLLPGSVSFNKNFSNAYLNFRYLPVNPFCNICILSIHFYKCMCHCHCFSDSDAF